VHLQCRILQSATLIGAGANTDLSMLVTPMPGADGVGWSSSPSATRRQQQHAGLLRHGPALRSTVFLDHFDYNSDKLTTDAPNFWTRRNASAQSVFFRSTVEPVGSPASPGFARTPARKTWPLVGGGPYAPAPRRFLHHVHRPLRQRTGANVITNGEGAFFRLSQGPTSASDFWRTWL